MTAVHAQDILHSDLSSMNILVTKDYVAKISDFGISTKGKQLSADGCGSARWRAPEMFIRTANKKGKMIGDICTNKIDVYGYSIILWELFHMPAIPWEEDLDEMVEKKVLSGQRMKLSDNVGSSWKQLIQSCWNQDPEQRPSFHRIVQIIEQIPQQN